MKRIFASAVAVALLAALAASAAPVEIKYDSGDFGGHFNQANTGDIEGVRFTPAAPCTLLSFRFQPINTGDMEWHVWGDNGGNMPDVTADLIQPVRVDVNDDADWITVDISDQALVINPPRHFHIGYVKLGDEPDLIVDGGNNVDQRSFIKIGADWYVTGDGSGNYLLRATVEYFDELNASDMQFADITQDAGVSQFSTCAWADYDNDGWEDLLADGRTLYRNLGDGTFENVSAAAGIVEDNSANAGAWGDFDNDGNLDFYAVTSDLHAQDRLYHSNGDGTFTFANDQYWLYNGNDETQAAGWGDADNDGCLELYIANSETWGDGTNPIYYPDYMWRYNAAQGIFEEITPGDIARLRYYGRGVAWCDFDMDGDMDLYISNYRLHPNFLLVNQGSLTFRNQARTRGVEGIGGQNAYGHTIGSAWGDYDNDGDFDLFVGNLAHPAFLAFSDKCMLYRNNGAPNWNFTDVRDDAGIKYDETASSPAWGDYDNDGHLDLFISSVYEGRQPYLYKNNGDGTFANVNYPAGFHQKCYNSWGVAWCDYDHDGDLDVAIGGNHGGLFQNHGDVGHYLQLTLTGTESNKFAYGAQATAHLSNLHQLRQVEGSTGTQACQNMMALHWGLGGSIIDGNPTRVDSLVIKWLSGQIDRYYNVPADARYIATEGEGINLAAPREAVSLWPLAFSLSTHPNPFNSRLTVEFAPVKRGRVTVEVYDLAGRKVNVLTDGVYSAGVQRLTWDASAYPSGSYLIQARYEGGMASRMVVLTQ